MNGESNNAMKYIQKYNKEISHITVEAYVRTNKAKPAKYDVSLANLENKVTNGILSKDNPLVVDKYLASPTVISVIKACEAILLENISKNIAPDIICLDSLLMADRNPLSFICCKNRGKNDTIDINKSTIVDLLNQLNTGTNCKQSSGSHGSVCLKFTS